MLTFLRMSLIYSENENQQAIKLLQKSVALTKPDCKQ